jgi:hypothetical protein
LGGDDGGDIRVLRQQGGGRRSPGGFGEGLAPHDRQVSDGQPDPGTVVSRDERQSPLRVRRVERNGGNPAPGGLLEHLVVAARRGGREAVDVPGQERGEAGSLAVDVVVGVGEQGRVAA